MDNQNRSEDQIMTKKCAIKKIKITGAQYYEGYHPAKEVFKSLGHFNGVYEIDGEKVNGHDSWTKLRVNSNAVSLIWSDDLFGSTGWVITNNPGQPRLFTKTTASCPHSLSDWKILEYGNFTTADQVKPATKLRSESLGDFKPVPAWVLAQLDIDDQEIDSPPVTDIYTMLAHSIPDTHTYIHNYGCSGISDFAVYKNFGFSPDPVSVAIDQWKSCISCSTENMGITADPYIFDKNEEICTNTPGNIERATCECDVELATRLRTLKITEQRKASRNCILDKSENSNCCFNGNIGKFSSFIPEETCCLKDGTLEEIKNC